MSRLPDRSFWSGRRVLVTGHTGFKGSWLCLLLHSLGAEVTGLSLPPSEPSAYTLLRVAPRLRASHQIDIRDAHQFCEVVRAARPEFVLHLAAQALVGESYHDPAGTFATNLTGTVNLLQALRGLPSVAATVIVTSDKVYRNDNLGQPFRESDPLGGHDPYSASKAAAELAVASWCSSYSGDLPPLATARAGNVIGGGDFGRDRLLPDLVRAESAGQSLVLRDPDATRPFQHVLDVLFGYLLLAQALAAVPSSAPHALNFGPQDAELRVREVIDLWEVTTGRPVHWQHRPSVLSERHRLALDSHLAAQTLGWHPIHDALSAITSTASWYDAWRSGQDMSPYSEAALDNALIGFAKESFS